MTPAIHDTLHDVFGYRKFRAQQREIIEHVIAGGDAFVLMPTGGGKSLCYQIPALHRSGVAVVVSPLIALMKDQVDALRLNGVRAAFLNSSLGAAEAAEVYRNLRSGELDLLYVAPERLLQEDFRTFLQQLEVALFAVDEAHCVSQWGHDFRPEYVQLGELRRFFTAVPMIALTATADEQTRNDIIERLALHDAGVFISGFDRPNIRYTVVDKDNPTRQLFDFVDQHRDEAGIVYALSRKRVDDLADKLAATGIKAAAYHAGMDAEARQRVQDAFLRDEIQIVVATVAFGMGIDKPNIRFVFHYDLPKNIESYYQETGRCGRDGLAAEAVLLFGYGDIALVRGLIEKGGNEEQKRIELHKLNAMVSYAEPLTCRRRALLAYFGDNLDEDCGNCDMCLNPPERYDATIDAQKVLSCVFRVGQRYGARHVIDVLRGADNQRIAQLRHNQLSTYGIGKDKSQQHWSSLIRQLLHLGYLYQDVANYSILRLSAKARQVLSGGEKLHLAKPRLKVNKAEKKPKQRAMDLDYSEELYEQLCQCRKKLAQQHGVPPYLIFNNATLMEMAFYLPRDKGAMLEISGVGKHKLEKYAAEFLAVIGEYCA